MREHQAGDISEILAVDADAAFEQRERLWIVDRRGKMTP
jgi:hypothetical protein